MARTIVKVPYKTDWEAVNRAIENFLVAEGFSPKEKKEENFWKKGTGMATAMQYIKVDYTEQEVMLSAWIQMGVGDVAGKEKDLSGIVAMIPKKSLKKRLDALQKIIASL